MTVIGAAEGVWPPSTLTTEYVAGRGRASVGVVRKAAAAMMVDLNEYRMLDLEVCARGVSRLWWYPRHWMEVFGCLLEDLECVGLCREDLRILA
jgi:hypothetical protein